MKKYEEDLDTTLIFVSLVISPRFARVHLDHRLVCSPQSLLPSSSTSSLNSSPTRVMRPSLSSAS